MTSIEYGAKVVSLISETKKHAGVSLSDARQMVKRLIEGEPVSVALQDEERLRAFKEAVEPLGARVE